jgi:hypothetical protein
VTLIQTPLNRVNGAEGEDSPTLKLGKKLQIPGHEVRLATREDLPACNELCRRIHGVDRGGELLDAIGQATAHVVERLGKITGYSTGIGLFQHAVGATNDDLKALIGAALEFSGTGFLLPSRNGEVFRWCLAKGLRVVSQSILMTIGLYNDPPARISRRLPIEAPRRSRPLGGRK